jgi:squalene-associated FAD-dependent desaturase
MLGPFCAKSGRHSSFILHPSSFCSPSPLSPLPSSPALAIIGGGLAGLAAAVAAVDRGLRVELFERANFLGGRAGSFVDSATGTLVDRCQHVVMGCCDEFLALSSHTGLMDCFESTDTYRFIAPDGQQFELAPVGWLPGPWRLLPGLLRLRYLSRRDRWAIVGALRRLALEAEKGTGTFCAQHPEGRSGKLDLSAFPLDETTFGQWLGSQRQSTGAIERFWSPIVLSTLGETVGRVSLTAVEKVFREAFLGSRRAGRLLLPQCPLREIFHGRLRQWLADRGVIFHLGSPVLRVEGGKGDRHLLPERPFGCCTQKLPVPFSLVLRDGTRRPFQWVIVAVAWRDVRRLLAEEFLAAMPELAGAERLEPAAIAAVHLWFDRPVVPLSHAALIGRLGQWVFARACTPQQYCQVVISAAHRVGPYRHDEWRDEILAELRAIWPEVGQARLLHARVVAQPAALFSARPGADRLRPPQRTSIPNLALAGDWTATGWPATMESAVRSGRQAVEALGISDGQ